MIASSSETSRPPCVEVGFGAGSSRCPCALRALDLCLAEARYADSDDFHDPQVYWDAYDDRPGEAASAIRSA